MIRPALLAAASLIALSAAAPSAAQDDRRFDRLEKSVRELRSIVFQGRDTGQPVVVRLEGPDPQVTALEGRVNDLEQTLQRVNGQLDQANHDLEEARRGVADVRANDADQLKALTDRLARLEAAQAPAPAAAAQGGAPAYAGPGPEEAGAPPGDPRTAATARAQAADSGTLGAPDGGAAPARPAAQGELATYKAAKALLASGDYPGAAAGFTDYTTRFPTGPRLAEARYWLGESLFIQDNYPDAARAYALALKGWPKTGWAPEATIKLGQSLAKMNRPEQACQAVGEFAKRYGAAANATSKARADAVRAQARCAG